MSGHMHSMPLPAPDKWLPTSVKELEARGWKPGELDVILFSGDAYIDHPSMGAAVVGRLLEAEGLKVAIVPQPNWQDDLRDFRKLGRPRLFFGVSAGAMDSMVNHYTAARRRRSDDAYTPGGRHGARPDYPTIVYSRILKELYPDVPVIAGGIEASMRRLSHYDYWADRLRPSLLADMPADMILYGMGELTIPALAKRLQAGENIADITNLPQSVVRRPLSELPKQTDEHNIVLHSFEECLRSKRAQAENFRHIEQQSNRLAPDTALWQACGDAGFAVKVNPLHRPLTTSEIDHAFDLPYTRLPHPRYRGKTIPAYEMIRHSVNLHRGCFGGCAFCTISAHQGKHIASRSKESVMKEVKKVCTMPDFKGYISDLGGPSANMYGMAGRDLNICRHCMRPSCLHPAPCPNLNTDHGPLLDIYRSVEKLPQVKKAFVGSGVRYDLAMHPTGNDAVDATNRQYCRELIERHVSGRLKVAPEHTSDAVLKIMRKPSFKLYEQFGRIFADTNRRAGLNQQLIPYFISSHPGCHEIDMAELACQTKELGLKLEQVQDFTPTPMTLSTEMFYTGLDPYTLKPVYVARTPHQKQAQRKYFFWYDPAYRLDIAASLRRLGRTDMMRRLLPERPASGNAGKPFQRRHPGRQ